MDADYMEVLERDRQRKWWQAKECPDCLFERAPLLCTALLAGWLIFALVPGILMLVQ